MAVEINCRPERQDPPGDLLAGRGHRVRVLRRHRRARSWAARLDRQRLSRAEAAGIAPDRVIHTLSADDLIARTRG